MRRSAASHKSLAVATSPARAMRRASASRAKHLHRRGRWTGIRRGVTTSVAASRHAASAAHRASIDATRRWAATRGHRRRRSGTGRARLGTRRQTAPRARPAAPAARWPRSTQASDGQVAGRSTVGRARSTARSRASPRRGRRRRPACCMGSAEAGPSWYAFACSQEPDPLRGVAARGRGGRRRRRSGASACAAAPSIASRRGTSSRGSSHECAAVLDLGRSLRGAHAVARPRSPLRRLRSQLAAWSHGRSDPS